MDEHLPALSLHEATKQSWAVLTEETQDTTDVHGARASNSWRAVTKYSGLFEYVNEL